MVAIDTARDTPPALALSYFLNGAGKETAEAINPSSDVGAKTEVSTNDVAAFILACDRRGRRHARSDLRKDRGGATLSKPFAVTERTLPVLTRAVLERSEGGGGLPRTFAPGGHRDVAMEFRPPCAGGAEYVPRGYEEFERGGTGADDDNDDGGSDGDNGRSDGDNGRGHLPDLYVFEVRYVPGGRDESTWKYPGGGAPAKPWLEDWAVVPESCAGPLDGIDYDGPEETSPPLAVAFVSSTRFTELLKDHGCSGGLGGGGSCDALKAELMAEPSLSLPIPLGAGPLPSYQSLVAIVTSGKDWRPEIGHREAVRGDVVLTFSRIEVHPLGGARDLFSSTASIERFYVGRAYAFVPSRSPPPAVSALTSSVEGDYGDDDPEAAEEHRRRAESLKLLREALVNASRFVPTAKRRQWDEVPDTYASVMPYLKLPPNLRLWLLNPFLTR